MTIGIDTTTEPGSASGSASGSGAGPGPGAVRLSATRSPAASAASPLLRRLARRELHSPRSTAAISLAVVLAIVALWLALETVLELIGQRPLLVAPGDIPSAAASLPTTQPVALGISAVVVIVVGLVLLTLAIGPGRRHRHLLATDRLLAVVDDEVIASALAQRASTSASTGPDGTVVAVGRRTATIRITPASGSAVDRAAVDLAVAEELQRYELQPVILATTVVSKQGKVGQ